MRKPDCLWSETKARQLLADAETVYLSTTTGEAQPVMRALHAVDVGDFIVFHSARAGEKGFCIGREAIVSASRVLCRLPSTFTDPERACPATTYYESVQVKGVLVELIDLEDKARAIDALMQKYQPEGGYQKITANSPLYKKALTGLLVYGLEIKSVSGKRKLGQNRSVSQIQSIARSMWQRGQLRDLSVIDSLVTERLASAEALPDFLVGPGDSVLRCQLGHDELEPVVELLRHAYWNRGVSDTEISRSHMSSSAWVGCFDNGHLVASARAISDGTRFAWVFDVVVARSHRRAGVGTALMKLLLDHPQLRSCHRILLETLDAQDFYGGLGFELMGESPPDGPTQMQLRRQ